MGKATKQFPIVTDALRALAKKKAAVARGDGDAAKRYGRELERYAHAMTSKAIAQFNATTGAAHE